MGLKISFLFFCVNFITAQSNQLSPIQQNKTSNYFQINIKNHYNKKNQTFFTIKGCKKQLVKFLGTEIDNI